MGNPKVTVATTSSPLLVASSTSVEKVREMSSICFAGAVAPRAATVRRAGVAGSSKRVRPLSVRTLPGKNGSHVDWIKRSNAALRNAPSSTAPASRKPRENSPLTRVIHPTSKTQAATVCMAQQDKQPEWFPEAKVSLRPSADQKQTLEPDHGCGGKHRRIPRARPNAPPLIIKALTNPIPTPRPVPQVFCNGEEVMTVGGTQAEYVVDIWSGNHPFFQGVKTAVMTNAGRVSRFGDKYGNLGELSEVETMDKAMAKKDEKK